MKRSVVHTAICLIPAMLFASEATEFLPSRDGGWNPEIAAAEDGFLITKETSRLTSNTSFEVDPKATYKLSGKFKRSPSAPPKPLLFFGLEALDKQGRGISSPAVFIYPETETELTSDLPAKGTGVTVRDASKWNTKSNACVIAFNVKDNLADLPNFSYSTNIKKIERKDNAWLITLAQPAWAGFKAGTKVRQHSHGLGRIYCAANYRQIVWDDWHEINGTVCGIAEHGAPANQWWKGTVRAKITISAEPGILLKDIKLEKIGGKVNLVEKAAIRPQVKADPLKPLFEKYNQELAHRLDMSHPRLLFTDAMFEKMRKRAASEPLIGNALQVLYRKIDLYPDEVNEASFSRKQEGEAVFYSTDKFGPTAMRAAFAYKMTGEKKYLGKALNILKYASEWYNKRYEEEKPVSWTSFSRISALCAYDWLYNEMTPSDRAVIGKNLLKHIVQAQNTDWIVQSGLQNKGEGTSRWNSSFYGTPLMKFYTGLAFHKAGIDDKAAEKLLEEGLADHIRMLDYRSEMAGSDGGGNNSTPGYAFGDAPMCEWLFYYAWKTLTGRNIATDFPANGLLPHWLFYASFTGIDGKLYEHGTGGAWHIDNKLKMNLRYLAQYRNFFPDSPAVGIIDFLISTQDDFKDDKYIYASGTWRHDGYFPWLLFQYNYTKQSEYKFDKKFFDHFPKAYFFRNLGQTYLFSGREPDSTYALFTCGSKSSVHKQADENNFIIYKGGFLALDSGTRSASGHKDWLDDMWHDNNYYAVSIAHNVVTIRMEGEKFSGWPAPKYAVANHGGMYKTTGGIVKAFETNNFYTYVSGDSTACYRPEKCKKMIRQFVFVQPDFFVICDTVKSVKPEQLKTWLLHSQNEPEESGDIVSFGENKGRLFCRTFLPEDFKREKIGGPGREFWVDGKNYPLGKTRLEEYAARKITNPLWGNWRIELTRRKPSESVRFLNLIQVGMADKLKKMATSSYVKNGTREGVKFIHDDTEYTILFDADGTGGYFKAVKNGKTLLEKELIQGIQPQTAFSK